MKKKKFFNLPRPNVFIPMSADFFHHGHINLLKRAKKYGGRTLDSIIYDSFINPKDFTPTTKEISSGLGQILDDQEVANLVEYFH